MSNASFFRLVSLYHSLGLFSVPLASKKLRVLCYVSPPPIQQNYPVAITKEFLRITDAFPLLTALSSLTLPEFQLDVIRVRLKCDWTRAEIRFRLSCETDWPI